MKKEKICCSYVVINKREFHASKQEMYYIMYYIAPNEWNIKYFDDGGKKYVF